MPKNLIFSIRGKMGKGIGLVLFLMLGMTGASVQAQPEGNVSIYHFVVPSMQVDSALTALAKQSGSQIIYSSELVSSYVSTAIDGQYTLDQALKRMLSGTDLSGRITDRGVIVVTEVWPRKV